MTQLNKLWTWMNTWKQGKSYGGFIIHPIHGMINFSHQKAVPSFTYLPLVRGLINLAGKDEYFEKELEDAKSYLLSEIDGMKIFRNSSFEFAPEYGTLIHNTFPVISLLLIAERTKDEQLISLCRTLIERLIIKYWTGKDYTGVINQDLSMCELISIYTRMSKDDRFERKYCLSVAERTLEYKKGSGLVRGRRAMEYMSPWYNSKKAESLFEIYKTTNDEKWLEQAKGCIEFTFSNFENGLNHSLQKNGAGWEKITVPKIICASSYPIKVYYDIFGKLRKKEFDFIKENQTKSGYFRNTTGYGIRDYIGSLPWNCFAFELLSLTKNKPVKCENFIPSSFRNGDYSIAEEKDTFKLNIADKTVFSVDKKTGINKKDVIDKNMVKVKVKDPETHVIFTDKKRVVDFGFTDKEGSVYYPDNITGKMKLWIPNRVVESFSEKNGFIKVKSEKKPDRRFYYNIRKVLFNTPLFDLIGGTKK